MRLLWSDEETSTCGPGGVAAAWCSWARPRGCGGARLFEQAVAAGPKSGAQVARGVPDEPEVRQHLAMDSSLATAAGQPILGRVRRCRPVESICTVDRGYAMQARQAVQEYTGHLLYQR
jgi:hypothetical protein